MRTRFILATALGAAALSVLSASAVKSRRIAIEWKEGRPQGTLSVTGGKLLKLAAVGDGSASAQGRFAAAGNAGLRLEADLEGSEAPYGAGAAIVTVGADSNPFSFFLRDVRRDHPIYIPEYGVIVTDAADPRRYAQVAEAILARGLQTKLEKFGSEPEESFANAAAHVRNVKCQTWLGMGRDFRIFGVSERLDWIAPRFHGHEVPLPEAGNKAVRYDFLMGRGWGAADHITRRLEEGSLPILHGELVDDDITYQLTAFAGLEANALNPERLRGTHFLVADGHGLGHMFTKEQQAQYDSLLPTELGQPEETVLFLRMTAVNTARVPRYAFFRTATARAVKYTFDASAGLAAYSADRVFATAKINGTPLGAEEAAVDLAPGETAVLDMYVPHRPIPRERALKLRDVSFDAAHSAARRFWKERLARAARISVPEKRIDEMIRAGLLHLDIVTYGMEPNATLTSTIGVYSAIGSETSPIVQFMDSMGWHDVARRSLTYFLDKQHEDGFIQNFGNYMLETGAALWSLGEHYRYTRDESWVRQVAGKLVKSCEYMKAWRERNLSEQFRNRGYGMLDGKTADPEDPFHSFMLNGYAYLGFQRVSEMLRNIDPPASKKWAEEAAALKGDIRTALFQAMGRSPAVPLADGSWCPTVPPWAEGRGALALFADGNKWFTHGAMVSRDSLLGPIYLIFQEVLDPNEQAAGFLLNFHNDLMTHRNAAFSQPYYSRHPVSHLRRGEVRPFLKSYYNTVASLADRETYTFWEHYFGASPHKTHEEGWFLMDTRWMLYMERDNSIDLLPGIPRAWMESGKQIELQNVATHFGPFTLRVRSRLEDQDRIEVEVESRPERRPQSVTVRVPHPLGREAAWVKGGVYDAATERVRIDPYGGRAEVTLGFSKEDAGR